MFGAVDQEYLEPMKLFRIAASALLASGLVAGSSVLPASAGDRETLDYVALGDSYAAGVGAGVPGFCGRSPLGYPGLLDERKQIELSGNATCGGAQSVEVHQTPVDVPDVPTQLAGLRVAGEIGSGTELVTLTVGGNDLDYLGVIGACGTGTPACEQAVGAAVVGAQTVLAPRLAGLYAQIRLAAPKAEVVVTGYPHLFSPEFGKTLTFPAIDPGTGAPLGFMLTLTPVEQQILNDGTDVLNAVIRAEAKKAGFTYVDVAKRFDRHGLGSPQPWIQPFTDPGALHPNARGYKNGYLHEIRNALN